MAEYWYASFLFRRGMGLVYLLAFVAAYHQFRPLIGENGITPFREFVKKVDFRHAPSIFHFFDSDRAFSLAAASGIVFATLATFGYTQAFGTGFSIFTWLLLWVLYLSIVSVGQIWYGYGWESMLLEAGFLTVFMTGIGTEASLIMIFLARWMLFRVMFGAGLIKLRGDTAWKDLTALNYHYETQPMPNPLSWFFHHLPEWWHKMETIVTHIVQTVVPLFYFAPQPLAFVAGAVTILFHLVLMMGGNYSWLNLLTIVLAVSTVPDSVFSIILPIAKPAVVSIPAWRQIPIYGYAAVVAGLSYYPIRNMLSSNQRMNSSFDPFHLVNTYGAFGSVTKTRYEVVIEGKKKEGDWKEYEFYGKPTKTDKMPPQIAPYHFRLGWQLWFAAMTPRPRRPWFRGLMFKLLEGDEDLTDLINHCPFEESPDRVRAKRYKYEFSSWEKLKQGEWWERKEVGTYFPEIEMEDSE